MFGMSGPSGDREPLLSKHYGAAEDGGSGGGELERARVARGNYRSSLALAIAVSAVLTLAALDAYQAARRARALADAGAASAAAPCPTRQRYYATDPARARELRVSVAVDAFTVKASEATDCEFDGTSVSRLPALPDRATAEFAKPFDLGLVVGPSGSGKTCVAISCPRLRLASGAPGVVHHQSALATTTLTALAHAVLFVRFFFSSRSSLLLFFSSYLSTLLSEAFGADADALVVSWRDGDTVASHFASAADAADRLGAVGLPRVAWTRAARDLSEAEQALAATARALGNGAIVDEFATALDRDAGIALARRVARLVRARGWKRVVLATTRTDVERTLAPDWRFSTAERGDFAVYSYAAPSPAAPPSVAPDATTLGDFAIYAYAAPSQAVLSSLAPDAVALDASVAPAAATDAAATVAAATDAATTDAAATDAAATDAAAMEDGTPDAASSSVGPDGAPDAAAVDAVAIKDETLCADEAHRCVDEIDDDSDDAGVLMDGTPPTVSFEPVVLRVRLDECHYDAWALFKSHHYLTGDINPAARCFVARLIADDETESRRGHLVDDAPAVAFTSRISQWGNHAFREHRSVVLPAYQGEG